MVPGEAELGKAVADFHAGEDAVHVAYGLDAPLSWREAAETAGIFSGSRHEIDAGHVLVLTPSRLIVAVAARRIPDSGDPFWHVGQPVHSFARSELGKIEVETTNAERTVLVLPLGKESVRLAFGITPTGLPGNVAQARAIAEAIRASRK
jgi:hypothetical protein